MASPIKVGPINLVYLFIKSPFGNHGSSFASEKVGPTMLLYPLLRPLRKTDSWLRNPPRRSSCWIFCRSTSWSVHWVLTGSGDEIVTTHKWYFNSMNHFSLIKLFDCIYKALRKMIFGVRNPPRRSQNLIFHQLNFLLSRLNWTASRSYDIAQFENLHRVRI